MQALKRRELWPRTHGIRNLDSRVSSFGVPDASKYYSHLYLVSTLLIVGCDIIGAATNAIIAAKAW